MPALTKNELNHEENLFLMVPLGTARLTVRLGTNKHHRNGPRRNRVATARATVIVDGTSRGVATDFDGNFSIQASQGETLLITYVGYADQRVTVGNQDNYIVNLSLDNELEEVVITGVAEKDRRSWEQKLDTFLFQQEILTHGKRRYTL